MRKVSVGQHFRTVHDVNDGFWMTETVMQYTLPRDDQKLCTCWVGFVDTPRSVQLVKSESHVVLINVESKYRYRLCRETDLTPGL